MASNQSELMVLVDTTVWIDFFADRAKPHVETLSTLIKDEHDICISGVILTEVLQGIRKEGHFNQIQDFFQPLVYLSSSRLTYIKSAQIYRFLRKKGITIRKSIDCIIAAIAIEHNVSLLHNDSDFRLIESNTELEIYPNLKK